MTKTLTDIKREAREELHKRWDGGLYNYRAFSDQGGDYEETEAVTLFLDTFADRLLEEVEKATMVKAHDCEKGSPLDRCEDARARECIRDEQIEAFAKFRGEEKPKDWMKFGYVCEQHPDKPFEHDDCIGPGMPRPASQDDLDRLDNELSDSLIRPCTPYQPGPNCPAL